MDTQERDNNSLARVGFMFFAVLVLCLAAIVGTESLLPARVITKWTNGRATNFMSRDEWIVAALAMACGAGLAIALAGWFSDRLRAVFTRKRWELTDPRPADSFRSRRLCLIAASGGTLWMTAFHFIVVRANSLSPPQLEAWPLAAWIAAWLIFVAWLVIGELRARRAAARNP